MTACGAHDGGGSTLRGADGADGSDADGGGTPNLTSTAAGGSASGDSGSGLACPAGLSCNVTCPGGGTPTVTGKVYDPAGKNPLYNVSVYVPAVPLTPLPKGVPTGNDACSCGALFPSGAITNTTTGVDGSFTLTNVPMGSAVPLVLQIGKWRRQIEMNVTCGTNAPPDTSLTLPGTVAAGDTLDNIPDIAVSTGSKDTLECLMLRMGISASEYVPGTSSAGHIHIFSGGGSGGDGVGSPEVNAMPDAPASSKGLWDSVDQLMPYDITLLSCEGGETYDANPQALEAYLNAGGRAFASHFHYAFFSGPLGSKQSYAAPPDWGSALATWTTDQDGTPNGDIGGVIDTTLNGSAQPFSKGEYLSQWLGVVGALGQGGVPAKELSIYAPRYNATVGPANTPSQTWITADPQASLPGATMYFSFDTPVDAPKGDGGTPAYCGRAVFSDLHVSGDPTNKDTENKNNGSPPPAGCDDTELSPQEKALEYMLFDLSSCVIPDTSTVSLDAGLPSPPPK